MSTSVGRGQGGAGRGRRAGRPQRSDPPQRLVLPNAHAPSLPHSLARRTSCQSYAVSTSLRSSASPEMNHQTAIDELRCVIPPPASSRAHVGSSADPSPSPFAPQASQRADGAGHPAAHLPSAVAGGPPGREREPAARSRVRERTVRACLILLRLGRSTACLPSLRSSLSPCWTRADATHDLLPLSAWFRSCGRSRLCWRASTTWTRSHRRWSFPLPHRARRPRPTTSARRPSRSQPRLQPFCPSSSPLLHQCVLPVLVASRRRSVLTRGPT